MLCARARLDVRDQANPHVINVLSISDLELYVTETSTGVCDPVTDKNVVRMRKPL